MPDDLQSFAKLLQTANKEALKKTDFLKQFHALIRALNGALAKIEANNQKDRENISKLSVEGLSEGDMKRLEARLEKIVNDYERKLNAELRKITNDNDIKLSDIKDEMGSIPRVDSKLLEKKFLSTVRTMLPKSELPAFNELVNGLVKKIDDQQKEIEKLKKRPIPKKMGMKKIPYVTSIDLSSQVDGATTDFLLPKDTVKVLGVWGTEFPQTFRDGIDYELVGRELQLQTDQVGTPQSGQTLHALIETLFYA